VQHPPDARGRVSILTSPLLIAGRIDDSDHSLATGMYVDMPDLHRLFVAPPITVKRLDHLVLQPKKFDRITSIYVDVVLGHVSITLSKKS
jgi:hypothetical protein